METLLCAEPWTNTLVSRNMYGPMDQASFNTGHPQKSALRCMNSEVDSVQRWLLDLQGATEGECMTLLETKPIHNSPLNLENVAATIKENIYRLQQRADCLSTEITQLFRKLKAGSMKQLRPAILSLCVHIRSCLKECNEFCPDMGHIQMSQQHVTDELGGLVKRYERSEGLNGNTQMLVIEPLASLSKALNSLLDAVQSELVMKLVMMVQDSASELNVKFAVLTVYSLSQESLWLRRLLVKGKALGALLAVCRIATLSIRSIVTTALQAISTLCSEPEGREEFYKIGGLGTLSEILASPTASERVKQEAASVLAEITSPDVDSYHRMLCFIEHMEDLIQNLTALCEQTCSTVVFLVATSAIANITFMDTMSSDYLAAFNTGKVLIEGYMKGKAPSMYSKHQVMTIIANMSGAETCKRQILEAGGMKLLVELLHLGSASSRRKTSSSSVKTGVCDGPLPCELDDDSGVTERADTSRGAGAMTGTSTFDQVYHKAAVALGRLCRDYETAMLAVELNVIPRLVELCRHRRERNDNESVLVACLAALRRLHSNVGGSPFREEDLQTLIQPCLMESFQACSSSDEGRESFV
ncbi:protein inscuteable homolog [Diadema setosum]|uniref:protein inscuteable homolog n=1 Tax=Diadema setosum TaxID=31175 RepID=UPI003B3BA08B